MSRKKNKMYGTWEERLCTGGGGTASQKEKDFERNLKYNWAGGKAGAVGWGRVERHGALQVEERAWEKHTDVREELGRGEAGVMRGAGAGSWKACQECNSQLAHHSVLGVRTEINKSQKWEFTWSPTKGKKFLKKGKWHRGVLIWGRQAPKRTASPT